MKVSVFVLSLAGFSMLAIRCACPAAPAAGLSDEFTVFVKQREEELLRVTKNDPAITEFLGKPFRTNDTETTKRFLATLVTLSQNVDGARLFIRQDPIVACLVQGLFHQDRGVRESALNYLFKFTLSSEYRGYVAQLIAAWQRNDSYELLEMIAATHTPEGDAFLRKLQVDKFDWRPRGWPDEILASLGEPGAEERLITRFLAETNAQAKCDLALKLGSVGTTNTMRALAREIRNPLIGRIGNAPIPLRYRIIQALGRAVPESRLFNEGLVTAGSASREVQEIYIGQVEEWCEKTLSIQWDRERPKDPLSFPLVHATPARSDALR